MRCSGGAVSIALAWGSCLHQLLNMGADFALAGRVCDGFKFQDFLMEDGGSWICSWLKLVGKAGLGFVGSAGSAGFPVFYLGRPALESHISPLRGFSFQYCAVWGGIWVGLLLKAPLSGWF